MKLPQTDQKTPFTTPEGYFDDLPQRVRKRAESRKPYGWALSALSVRYALPMVAVSVILLVIWVNAADAPPQAQQSVALSDVSDEALLAYLEDYGVTEEELLEASGDEELAEALRQTEEPLDAAFDFLDEDFTLEEIDSYY